MSRRFTISDGLSSAKAMVPVAWRSAGLALALLAVSYTLFNAPDEGLPPAAKGFGFAAYMLLSLCASGALYRLASLPSGNLHSRDVGPGGLQWRNVEWALLRLSLAYLAIFVLIALLLILVLAGVAAASGIDPNLLQELSDPESAAAAMRNPEVLRSLGMVGVLLIFAYCVLVWAAIRLSLATVATAISGKVELFSTWKLTKGHFWTMAGGLMVVSLPSVIVGIVVGILDGAGRGAGADSLSAEGQWALAGAGALVAAFVVMPMQIGFIAEAYRKLTEEPADAF